MGKLIGWSALALVLGLPLVAGAGVGPRVNGAPEPTPRWQRAVLPVSQLAFDVPPVLGATMRTEAYPRVASDRQLSESVTVAVAGTERVRVDVWRAPRTVVLEAWFEARFDKELDERTTLWADAVGVDGAPALRVSQPAGCGVSPRELAVLQLGAWVIVVTLGDADDPDATAIFKAALATIELVGRGGL